MSKDNVTGRNVIGGTVDSENGFSLSAVCLSIMATGIGCMCVITVGLTKDSRPDRSPRNSGTPAWLCADINC